MSDLAGIRAAKPIGTRIHPNGKIEYPRLAIEHARHERLIGLIYTEESKLLGYFGSIRDLNRRVRKA
jgi:hypothetical protein